MIDSHAHIGQFKKWNCQIEELYRQMQKAGIKQAIITNIAGNTFDYEHKRLNKNSSEEINRQTLEAIKKYQDTFKMLVWIRPLEEESGALANLIEAHRNMIVGIKVHPYCAKVKLGDEKYEPYIALCQKYDLVFCVHTEEDGYSNVEYMEALVCRYPKVKFVAVHMGLRSNHKKAIEMIAKYPNLYGDTTLVDTKDVIDAIKKCGKEKILFGSDAIAIGDQSYERYLELYQQIDKVFGAEVAKFIFHQNVLRVFKIEDWA